MSVPCHSVRGESKTPTPAPSLQQWPPNLLNRDLEPPLETEKGLGQPGYPSSTAGGAPVTCQPSQNPPEPRKIGATLGRGSAGPIYLAPPARRSPALGRAAQPLPARAGHPAGRRAGSKMRSPPGPATPWPLLQSVGRKDHTSSSCRVGGGCHSEEAGLSVSPEAILSCPPEGTFLGTEGPSATSAPRCLGPLPLPAPCFFLVPHWVTLAPQAAVLPPQPGASLSGPRCSPSSRARFPLEVLDPSPWSWGPVTIRASSRVHSPLPPWPPWPPRTPRPPWPWPCRLWTPAPRPPPAV